MNKTPQVGDLLVLDGRTRRITALDGAAVTFDHPNPEAEATRRTAMAAWKADGCNGPAPEGSRRGTIGTRWLYWLDGLNCWAVQGRVEARRPNPDAVQVGVATLGADAAEVTHG